MKKVYRFNLIPGVEFIENDGFYYAAYDSPDRSDLNKVIIDGLLEYERENGELKTKLKNSKFTISVLNDQIEHIKKCAENEIDHRNKLLEENDKSIEYLRSKLHEEILKSEAYKETIKTLKKENTNLIDQIAKSPISKSPVPLSSASDCYDLYICTPDHIIYGHIAGEFGVGLYVGDTLILLKGDKASEVVRERSSMTDRISTLETTLKKKSALADTLMSSIEVKNSEIKVLSDQVTRLMDQLKEATKENSGCKSCMNGPEPCCDICGNTDCEHRIETKGKSETNPSKALRNLVISALDIWLKENTDTNQRLEEDIKED